MKALLRVVKGNKAGHGDKVASFFVAISFGKGIENNL